MHIGIVLHPFGNSSRGLEQYVFESTKAILAECAEDVTFTVFVKGHPDTSGLKAGTHIQRLPRVPFWGLFLLFWYKKCDTFVFFTESAPFFLWQKSIIVFLDAAYYYFVKDTVIARVKKNLLVWWRKCMMQNAQHVVTISHASKKDLEDIFLIPPTQISVIYPGFKLFKSTGDTRTTENTVPYFIYVGPLKERKNVFAIVDAYIQFRDTTNYQHELLLVGRKVGGEDEDKVNCLIAESIYSDSIIFKTSVSDKELQVLYTNADALVFTSLLEGFGLPILEALSCGCFVITSSTTSTKEVVGPAGIVVNPRNTDEITRAMITVARHGYNNEEFKYNAIQQCAKFSWEKSGQEWNTVFNL